jgi:hypothetical protein
MALRDGEAAEGLEVAGISVRTPSASAEEANANQLLS